MIKISIVRSQRRFFIVLIFIEQVLQKKKMTK